MRMDVKERSQVPERYTWDLSSMYASDEDFLAALQAAQDMPQRLARFRGHACENASGLLAFLEEQDACNIELARLTNYAERKCDEDTRIALYQDFCARVTTLCVQVSSAVAWFDAELLACDAARVKGFYEEEPALEGWRRAIERVLARRSHTL